MLFDTNINILRLKFNETVFSKYQNLVARLYFMDKANSIQIYPDENDILGNSLKVRLGKYRSRISTYKIKISRSHHVQGDPLLQCTEYTRNNPYNDCIQKELFVSLNDIIGCRPPLLGKDHDNICNGRFNFSTAKEMQIKKMFQQIYLICEYILYAHLSTTRYFCKYISYANIIFPLDWFLSLIISLVCILKY